jgi:hypothetical protein
MRLSNFFGWCWCSKSRGVAHALPLQLLCYGMLIPARDMSYSDTTCWRVPTRCCGGELQHSWAMLIIRSDVSDLLISKTNWTGWWRTQSPVCYIVKPNDIYFFCRGLGLECHHLMTLASHWSSGKKLSESMCSVSSYLSALATSVQCYHIYNFHHPRLQMNLWCTTIHGEYSRYL